MFQGLFYISKNEKNSFQYNLTAYMPKGIFTFFIFIAVEISCEADFYIFRSVAPPQLSKISGNSVRAARPLAAS